MSGSESRIPSERWVAGGLGVLLTTAGILKFISFPESQPHLAMAASVSWGEISLSFWLLSGIRLRWSLRVAALLFLCFAMDTLWMVIQGKSACGCFGALSVSPKVTYWIDLTAFTSAMAALFREHLGKFLPVILVCGIGLFGGALALAAKDRASEMTVGYPWPVTGDVDCAADLASGRWVVFIYSSDCNRCQALASNFAREAAGWHSKVKNVRFALLDVDARNDSEPMKSCPGVTQGILLKRDLYQHSPILLLLDHGIVKAVEERWDEVDWSVAPYSQWIE
jgi:hypothetical protein